MKNLIKYPLLVISAGFFLSGCVTPRVAINPRADFSAINRVAVITITGEKGHIAADLMDRCN
jgi:starvation-inducible outer membrane lipoprotein